MTIPFRHLTGQSIGWRELGSSPPCSACLELLAWVVPGACWKERKPLYVHQDPIHPHLSRWASRRWIIFPGRGFEPLGALLEGAAEPLDAILWGLAEPLEAVLGGPPEPLSVSEEHLADSHGTLASADTVSTPRLPALSRSIPIQVHQKKAH